LVGSDRKPGQDRDAFAGGHEGLHDNRVVAEERDAWSEALLLTHGEQLLPAPLATADPGGVTMVRKAVVGSLAHKVDRVVEDVDKAKSLLVVSVVLMAIDEGDIDLTMSQGCNASAG
jgi:hypothetical protein